MPEELNKQLFFDNVMFLLKEKGKRIGEFESEAGVSAGYVSRTSKDEKTKPGIDFIMNAASVLNVSIDMLLKHEMAALSATDLYLTSFLSKLLSDTLENRLEWGRETADYLNYGIELDILGKCPHPLFSERTFFEKSEIDYPNEVTRIVFTSDSFGPNTYIEGDCFNLSLSENAVLYVMKISKSAYDTRENGVHAIEVWMTQNGENSFLCSTKGEEGIADIIRHLYDAVQENEKQPKIRDNVRNIIDAFMQKNTPVEKNDDNIPW